MSASSPTTDANSSSAQLPIPSNPSPRPASFPASNDPPNVLSDPTTAASTTQPSSTSSDPAKLHRPSLGGRQSSGTIIISRDCPTVETGEETYDEADARAMSPRKSSEEIDRIGTEARDALEEQAKVLQANLMEIVERVESVKKEHEKLESRNTFLQTYIGDLMQTSKITATGAGDAKSKGRGKKGK